MSSLKCANCGSTKTIHSPSSNLLQCNHCRLTWKPEDKGLLSDLGYDGDPLHIKGLIEASGAQKIEAHNDLITVKCGSCGAEIVVNTDENLVSKCHWCRQSISAAHTIANGVTPDGILPFTVDKSEAEKLISDYCIERKTFVDSSFMKNFSPNKIQGFYIPYFIADINFEAAFKGIGAEVNTEDIDKKHDEKKRFSTLKVERVKNIGVQNMPIVSKKDYFNSNKEEDAIDFKDSNHILEAILPYDFENAVVFNPVFLQGYSADKRDINMREIKETIHKNTLLLANKAMDVRENDDLKQYVEGKIRWDDVELNILGVRTSVIYLPVWLYVHHSDKDNKKYFIAVNGRTKETWGDIPFKKKTIAAISAGISLGSLSTLVASMFLINKI